MCSIIFFLAFKNLRVKKVFICFLFTTILFLPLTASLTYASYLSILFFVLSGALGLEFMINNYNKINFTRINIAVIIFILLLSTLAIYPHYEQKETLESNNSVAHGVKSSGFYLNNVNAENVYGDHSALNRKMSIYSDSVIFRVTPVHYLLLPNVEEIFLYEEYNVETDLTLLSSNPDELFVYEDSLISMRYIFDEIPNRNLEDNRKWLNLFQISYYVHFETDAVGQTMHNDLSNNTFKLYENEDVEIYYI